MAECGPASFVTILLGNIELTVKLSFMTFLWTGVLLTNTSYYPQLYGKLVREAKIHLRVDTLFHTQLSALKS